MEDIKSSLPQKFWWVILLRGIFIILFGVTAVTWPGLTFLTLVYLFGIFLLADGILDTILGLSLIGKSKDWYLYLLLGIIQSVIGIFAMRNVGITSLIFVWMTGATFILRGIIDIIDPLVSKVHAGSKIMSIALGVLAIIAGVIILSNPVKGVLVYTWVIGVFSIIAGPFIISSAFALKGSKKK